MKKSSKIIALVSVVLAFNLSLSAENPCGIMFPKGKSSGVADFLLYPEKVGKLKVYFDDDTTQNVGTVLITQNSSGANKFKLKAGSGLLPIRFKDVEMVSHTTMRLLKVYETCGDFYRILQNEYGYGVFIKKSDCRSLFKKLTYKSILFDHNLPPTLAEYRSWGNIGINITDSCLRLRSQPTLDAEILDCIPGNDIYNGGNAHMKIKKIKGNWVFVEVVHKKYYREDEDESGCGYSGRFFKKETGWIKAVEDSGFCNLWFSYTSY